MKRIGYLFEKIASFENLRQAAMRASCQKRNRKAVGDFLFNCETEIITLQNELLSGSYHPGEYHRFLIKDPKEREICVAPFRDRVIHQAVCHVLDPIFSRRYIHDSYACRKGKGTHKALKRAQLFSKKYDYFLKCDIRKFYDSVDRGILREIIHHTIKDDRVISLLESIIRTGNGKTEISKGLPIGNLTSQHFANLYLDRLDHFIKEDLLIAGYVRYMDDFILFGNSKMELKGSLKSVETVLFQERNLNLKEKATLLGQTMHGIPFLGFQVFPHVKRVRRANLKRFVSRVRKSENQYLSGRIDKEKLIRSVTSSIAHYSHGNTLKLRQKLFDNPAFDL